jgi:hypothetical protein
MEREDAQARIREVQRIMERAALHTLLPGAPALIGGALALAGCAVSLVILRSADFARAAALPAGCQVGLWVMWALIGAAALGQEIVLTARAAARRGLSFAERPARLAAYSLTPSVLVAAVLTFRLLADGHLQYLAPVWMMCYGTGVYAAGLFSLRLPRLLGLGFIVLGAAGLLCFPAFGVILVALSFGLLHVAFGLIVIRKSREDSET